MDLTTLINKPLRITLSDQRIVAGELSCIDNETNMIIDKAIELRPPQNPNSETAALHTFAKDIFQPLGQVMISGSTIIKVERMIQ